MHKFAKHYHVFWEQFLDLPLIVIYMYWDFIVYDEQLQSYYMQVNPFAMLGK